MWCLLACSYLEPYTKVPLWDESLGFDAIQLSSIVDRYMQRNCTRRFRSCGRHTACTDRLGGVLSLPPVTTTFDYQYPLWTTDLGFGSSAASPASRSFDAAVTINVPSNMVQYVWGCGDGRSACVFSTTWLLVAAASSQRLQK